MLSNITESATPVQSFSNRSAMFNALACLVDEKILQPCRDVFEKVAMEYEYHIGCELDRLYRKVKEKHNYISDWLYLNF